MTNGILGNSVTAFSRNAEGRLQPVGSFSTGGTGSGVLENNATSLILGEGNQQSPTDWAAATGSSSQPTPAATRYRFSNAPRPASGRVEVEQASQGNISHPISLTLHSNVLYVLNGATNCTAGNPTISGFTKVLCWVALDWAIQLAPRLGSGADPDGWCRARQRVRDAVLAKAWSHQAGAYTGAFGSDQLDALVLLLPLVGFLPASDPRMRATVQAVERELGDIGLVRRWPQDPLGFLICTYWLSECLALAGETERPRGVVRAGHRLRQRPGPPGRGGRPDRL